ncbi:hypothetical protein SAMN05444484_10132 [Flavobacterium chilense]|uniref:Uncharacterized protein n=1 Tax=Flavobacterium chilense TaxID=946677 RepID=A0A1M6X7P0_9FLAO|nr:hypothetical protein SAMN05444484_10132 [Flavobacterium chilense]
MNQTKQDKKGKAKKLKASSKEINKTVKSEYCFCNCTGCGFDRHCGGAFCYYKVH